MKFAKSFLLMSAAVGATVGLVGTGAAQEQESPSSIGEIVVTAEKRSASIQDVPVAVTAFTAGMREQTGLITAQQQLNFTPGVNYTSASDRLTIRGVGRVTNYSGIDPGVAVYQDGFYNPSVVSIGGSTLNVDRVEVLRGPQGTLYGRNSIGGAVNTISRRPSDEFEAEVRGTFNDWEGARFEGRVAGPLNDHVRGSLSASVGRQDEGYFNNVSGNPDEGGIYENWTFDAQLDYDLGPRFEGWVRYFTTSSEGSGRASANVSPYGVGILASTVNPTYGLDPLSNPSLTNHRNFESDRRSLQKVDDYDLLIAEHTWHGDSVDLKYIAGYNHYDTDNDADGDATARRNFGYPASCISPAAAALLATGTLDRDNALALLSAPYDCDASTPTDTANDQAYLDRLALLLGFGGLSDAAAFFASEAAGGGAGYISPGSPAIPLLGLGAIATDGPVASHQATGLQNVVNDLSLPSNSTVNRFSHELNLTSTHEGPLQYLFGAYYYQEETRSGGGYRQNGQPETFWVFNPADPTNPSTNPDADLYVSENNLQVESWALFTQWDYDFSDTLHGTAGIRYSHDSKVGEEFQNVAFWLPVLVASPTGGDSILTAGSVAASYFSFPACPANPGAIGATVPPGQICPISRTNEQSWQHTTGTLGLQWTPSEDTLVYGRFATGYKSGGFNLGLFAVDPTVNKETIDSFELGWKQTLGPAFQFNSALFFYQYHDLQVNRAEYPTPGVVINALINVPESESRGLELETIWSPTDNFRVMANYTYLDTEIVEAPDFVSTSDPFAVRPGARPTGATADPQNTPGNPLDDVLFQSVIGNELPGSPNHKAAINAAYTFNLPAGDLTFSATANWRSSQYYTIFNTPDFYVPEATTVDARVVFNTADDHLTIIGSVQNLFDEEVANGFETLEPTRNYYQLLYLEPPRIISVEMQYRF